MIMSHARCCTLLLALLVTSSSPTPALAGADEKDVRTTFVALQKALKTGDPEKIWPLLDKATQAAAERTAKALKDRHARAKAKDKTRLEKMFGLKPEEMTKLTGKLYLKTTRFQGKHDEIPPSKIDKITVEGDKATVAYTEPDGDKEKLSLVRQGGKWKVVLRID
jgi:hypothetical protein